jgi:hypothetical protein
VVALPESQSPIGPIGHKPNNNQTANDSRKESQHCPLQVTTPISTSVHPSFSNAVTTSHLQIHQTPRLWIKQPPVLWAAAITRATVEKEGHLALWVARHLHGAF